MSKPSVSPIYISTSIAIAFGLIGILSSCQSPAPPDLNAKIITYGRSQLNLNSSQAVNIESQQPQPVNTSDICQTTEPTQAGFVIKLVTADIRYILHTNADASKIEICGSEDAQPAATGKYTGTGYTLRYPANWQAIDFGLEPSGASTVIFTPQLSSEKPNEKLNPETALQNLQKNLKTYAIIKRIPIAQADLAKLPQDAKAIGEVPFDYQVKAAKAGSKVQFTEAIANSNNVTNWQVQALTLQTEQFIYTIRYYQPDLPSLTKGSSTVPNQFEQFVSSFALIP